jgi:uncharacterized membrane protein YkvA (DUF1232 family)
MRANRQNSMFQDDLHPDIKMRFDSLCQSPSSISTSQLANQILDHLQKIQDALKTNEFLNFNVAQQAADLLGNLINHLDDYSAESQRLIIGAAQYFVLDDDHEPDTKSPLGFDDDIQVLNFVLETLGKPKLKE